MCCTLLQDKKNQHKQAEKQHAKKLAEQEPKLDKLISKKVKPIATKKFFSGKQAAKQEQNYKKQFRNPSSQQVY